MSENSPSPNSNRALKGCLFFLGFVGVAVYISELMAGLSSSDVSAGSGVARSEMDLGSWIVGFILITGLIAMLFGLRHLLRYGSELGHLRTVEMRLAEVIGLGSTGSMVDGEVSQEATTEDGDAKPEASNRSAVIRQVQLEPLQEAVPASSLVGERLAAIGRLRRQHVRVNVDTLQQLSEARDEASRGLAMPGFVASLAMILGVFGTFVGMAVMVREIQVGLPDPSAAFDFERWTESISHLRSVLGGMETAFVTSLFGMGCAIVCLMIDYLVRRRQATFFEHFERFTVERLLPATVPAVDDENLLERVSFQLERSFERLEEVHASNRDALQELSGLETGFRAMIEEIRTITRTEAGRDMDKVVDELVRTSSAVIQIAEQVPRLASAVERRAVRDVQSSQAGLTISGDRSPAAVFWVLVTCGVLVVCFLLAMDYF